MVRLVHLLSMIIACLLMCFAQAGLCWGDASLTSACENWSSSCTYNRLMNCRYYHQFCGVHLDASIRLAAVDNCSNVDVRAPFTGQVDLRMVLPSKFACLRCMLLHEQFTAEEDVLLTCSGEWDAAKLDPAGPCGDHDLSFACPTAEAGALSSSCYNVANNKVGMYTDVVRKNAEENVPASFTTVSNQFLPNPGEGEQEKATRWYAVFFEAEADGLNASQCSKLDQGSENTTTTTTIEPLGEQKCYWAPPEEDYFFESDKCSQAGSFASRQCKMYVYLVCCGWAIITLSGAIVKKRSRPEPWFFNPHPPKESGFWKLLRYLGP